MPRDEAGADLERRFGGLRRLYGDAGYERLRGARVAVVGLGGVGSWTAEALARSGVAALALFDLDHVAESNVNRQVHALTPTLGQAKVLALRERIADIHPGCCVTAVEAFVAPGNWPALLPHAVDVLVDACDQSQAKRALAAWSLAGGVPLVTVGAAGGKRRAELVDVADLSQTTHDPLLASLRQRLRRDGVIPRSGAARLRCVFSREAVARPAAPGGGAAVDGTDGADNADGADRADGLDGLDGATGAVAPGSGLNCAGYGSSVTVTATFGMVAAGEAIALLLARRIADAGLVEA